MLPRCTSPDPDLGTGERALHIAAYYQVAELVSIFIEQGVGVRFASSKYGCPISAALEGLLASGLGHKLSARNKCQRQQCPCGITFEERGKAWMKFNKSDIFFFFFRSANSFHDGTRHFTWERIIRSLLSVGVEINAQDRPLGPPLHVASFIGSVGIVELFLQEGANINEQGGFFGTALIAAACGDQET